MTNTNRTAIESLSSFAINARADIEQGLCADSRPDHKHLVAFAHMCTSAIQGESWAIERMNRTLVDIERLGTVLPDGVTDNTRLAVILATDTARPDGAVARSVEV